jgi:hypothetical protein
MKAAVFFPGIKAKTILVRGKENPLFENKKRGDEKKQKTLLS